MNFTLTPPEPNNLLFRLILLTKHWRQVVDQKIQSSGLTDATWRPLLHLLLRGDGICQKDLADSIGITGPSLVRLLDTLLAKKLIIRREDPEDRRAKKLYLTEAGEQLARQIQDAVSLIDDRLLAGLSGEEHNLLLKMTQHLENNLSIILHTNQSQSS